MERVKTVLIASGSGTDANAIMEAYVRGQIPNIELVMLISTKEGAGCLEKAKDHNINTMVLANSRVNGKKARLKDRFNEELGPLLNASSIKLVFLVGCILKVNPVEGITFYNIHPACIKKYGGKGMYGLKPHKEVLLDIQKLVLRGRRNLQNRFFTTPTVHEVNNEYDSGYELLKVNVEIPRYILAGFIINKISLEKSAEELQQHVLPFEWMILPVAVKIAANKIIKNQ